MKSTLPVQFLRIRNFEKYQHYKDRRPPWVKLYRDLWLDPSFMPLSDTQKLSIIGLFTIASETDNRIPCNPQWIRKRLAITFHIDISALIQSGFVEPIDCDASTLLASCTMKKDFKTKQPIVETETEVQKYRDRETEKALAASPPTERKKDEAFEIFCSEFVEHRLCPYRSSKGDFVQLAALRKALDKNGSTPDGWSVAIHNYFNTPQGKYTLADLCSRFDVFKRGALDRFGKPREDKNGPIQTLPLGDPGSTSEQRNSRGERLYIPK